MAKPQSSVAKTYHLTPHDHVVGNSPLHSACYNGKLDIVKLLILQQSCDINGENHQGNTPLGLACKAGHKDVVSFLLTLSTCDLNHRNKAGNTPLHIACLERNYNIVSLLCSERETTVDTKNRYGDAPLGLACSSGNSDIVEFLVNQMDCNIATENRDGNSPLHLACHSGHLGIARFLTNLPHCDLNFTNKDGNTPLHLACQSGWLDIVKYLIDKKGSTLNCYNLNGNTPLYTAIVSHQKDVAMFLCKLEHCDISHTNNDGDTTLHLASSEGWSDMADLLARVRHCDINSQNNQGNTALHIASLEGHKVVVEILIEQPSCVINCENQHGNTPLSLACQNRWEEIVELLINIQNCNLNHTNKSGITPVHLSCYNRHQRIVKILIRDERCDVECKDMNENTPLGLVCNLGWTDIVKYLLTERQSRVDSKNKYGDTPLHLACSGGYLEVVKLIVAQKNCDINCRNNRGDAPFSLACQSSLEVVEYLSAHKKSKSFIQNNNGSTPLHHACEQSRLDIVEFLVNDLKHEVNYEDNDGNTPLSWSLVCETRWENLSIVQFFVSLPQCHINHQNKEGNTPLHLACQEGHANAVVLLSDVEHCNFNLQNKHGQTPAQVAMKLSHANILQVMPLPSLLSSVSQKEWISIIDLLSRGRDLTVPSHFQSKLDAVKFVVQHKLWDPNCPNEYGSIALHFASSDLVEYLVHEQGCDVNHRNKRGNTPLHAACLIGDLDIVRALITIDECNINLQNKEGNTPLHVACREGHKDAVVLLTSIEHCDFNLQNKEGNTPAMLALGLNHTDILVVMPLPSLLTSVYQDKWISSINLFGRGRELTVPSHFQSKLDAVKFVVQHKLWDPKCLNEHGSIALHYTTSDLVEYLVHEQGCDVNHRNERGNTPLHVACLRGDLDTARALTSIKGCNINLQNKEGNTPLHIASSRRYLEVVKLLVTLKDCDINYTSNRGDTPFSLACQSSLEVVKFLSAQKRCETFIQNSDGNTPLHHACAQSRLDIVKFLVSDLKHEVNCENNDGNTPLSWSLVCVTRWKNLSIVQFFVSLPQCHINHQNKEGNTPLHLACQEGHADAVVLLSDVEHCNFNLQNRHGQTPAQIAMKLSHANILQVMPLPSLLSSVNQKEWISIIDLLSRGRELTVPSHFQSKLEVVKFVVQHKLWDPKCPNENGSIALHFASSDLVEYLVHEQRCDVNHQNKRGNTPLHVACLKGDLDKLRALTSIEGCIIQLQNEEGNTPLHLACQEGHADAVVLLSDVEHCNFNLQNKHGQTPAQVAMKLGHANILQVMPLPSLLSSVSQKEWISIIDLLSRGRDLTVPSHFQSKLDAVKFVVQHKLWDPKCPNEYGSIALHFASSDLVEYLVHEQGCDVNHQNKRGNTPLQVACLRGDLGAVKALVCSERCNVNLQNNDGDTPLHVASWKGHKNAVVLLSGVEHCDFNLQNKRGKTPIQVAMHLNNTNLQLVLQEPHQLPSLLSSVSQDKWISIIDLLCRGRKLTVPSQFQSKLEVVKFVVQHKLWDPKCPNENGSIALHFASSDLVEYLVHEQGCDVNHQNKKGNTPLHVACLMGDLGAVRALTSIKECDINSQNNKGNTALHIAALKAHKAVVEVLIQQPSCDINCVNQHDNTPLSLACRNGWEEIVKLLINIQNCNLNHKNKSGITPIHLACYHQKIVEILIRDERCDVECKDMNENTPLGRVCHLGWTCIVEYLITERQSCVGSKNKYGDTPLHLACSRGNLEVVKVLVAQMDCDINCRNNRGDTPFSLASQCSVKVVKFLSVQKGCQSFIQNSDGDTPLHHACALSRLDIVKLLVNVLKHDVNYCEQNHQNKRGNTPLHIACLRRDLDIVRALTSDKRCHVNVQNDEGDTPLHISCNNGDKDAVRMLTQVAQCNISIRNRSHQTPAFIAFNLSHADILCYVVAEYCDECLIDLLESVGQKCWSAVVHMLGKGKNWRDTPTNFHCSEDIFTFLVQHQLWDLHKHGTRLLFVASFVGCLDVVRILLTDKSCNVNYQNKRGETPFIAACQQGHSEIVQALALMKGCDLYVSDSNGDTPLHHACRNCHYRTVLFLVEELKYDVHSKNKCGETPALVACLHSHPTISHFHRGILRLLLSEQHPESLCDIMRHIKRDSWGDIVNIIIGGDSEIDPSTWFSPLDVIRYMVAQQTWPWNPAHPDQNGSTALHYASQSIEDTDLLKLLLEELNCDLNLQNKEGNTPIHIACQVGNLNAIRILMSHGYCELNTANNDGETPAVIALNHQHPDILRLIIRKGHPKCLISLLETTDPKEWPNITNILKEDTRVVTTSHFSSLVDVLRFLVQHHILELDCTCVDLNGNTALHCVADGPSEIVKFLLNDQCCDIFIQNSDGNSPLHIACQKGNLEVVKVILNKNTGTSESACNLDVPNNQGETPLHCACSKGHVLIVKMLILSDIFDPTSVNAAGLTPIDLTTEYQVIKELSAYAKFRSSSSPPVWSNIKVCVIGEHSTGKTTLVEVLSRESTRFWKVVPPRFRRVTNTEHCTAGIVPVRLQSKKFGNVILYDFAGHKEYYSSHAAVLENFKSKSPPPLFIILLKLTASREDITKELYYWTSMIENHCKLSTRPPKVLVVGSFADELKAKGGSVREVSEYVQQTINSFRAIKPASDVVTSSLEFVGFVPLDCRVQATGPMDKLSDLLAKTCQGLQASSDTGFGCHVLYTFLIDRYKGRVACSVAEIMESVKTEDALALYSDAPSLVHLLKSLSDFGEIILLANQENPNQGWVILDSKVLLSVVNATVFAPEYLRQYKKGFAMSTGVVSLSKIRETFSTYDSEMVTQFLTHLEFCQEIKDPSVLPDIMRTHQVLQRLNAASSPAGDCTPIEIIDCERYLFFPALVSLDKTDEIWGESEESLYKCGWLLQCVKPGKFLTTRFLHVLLLRLAFAYAPTPQLCHFPKADLDPHEFPQNDPVLRKRCSVWKSGIRWLSSSGIETIVDVSEQTKVVAILMRCPKDREVECECAELRSSVIGKILSIQQEFCPAVTPMMESLIHPKDVQYPLKDGREMRIYNVNEIAQRVIENKPFTIESMQRGMIYMEDLLLFEPYLGLGVEIVQQFFSSKSENKEVTEHFLLNQLASQTFKRLCMYKKMINPNEARYAELCEQAPFNQVKQCYYLFQLWSKRGNATFKALRQVFDGYSIFHGRNPLVSSYQSVK